MLSCLLGNESSDPAVQVLILVVVVARPAEIQPPWRDECSPVSRISCVTVALCTHTSTVLRASSLAGFEKIGPSPLEPHEE